MFDTQSFYNAVGNLIRKARERAGISQERLAAEINLTRTSITNIEKGRQKIMLHTLVEIARILNVEPSSLLPSQESSLEKQLNSLPEDAQSFIKSVLKS